MAKHAQVALFVAAMAAVGNLVGAYDNFFGVYYGLEGDDLPPPPRVVQLCRKYNIQRVRLSRPNLDVIEAFRGMDIDISFGVPNDLLLDMASNKSAVEEWFNTYVEPYIGDFVINYIFVGDKVIPGLHDCILPVMKSMQDLLNARYLGQVKLTTLVGYNSALAVKEPPSSGAFNPIASDDIRGILEFLSNEGSPLMVSVYPYRKYMSDGNISLNYATFGQTEPVVCDGPLDYYNLFDEMVDAFYAAIEKENVGDVAVAVGETGWPTCGNGWVATPAFAAAYNNGFREHISSGEGTPMRPDVFLEGFVQSLFDENEKPEGESQCYGMFDVDLNPIYCFPTLYPHEKRFS